MLALMLALTAHAGLLKYDVDRDDDGVLDTVDECPRAAEDHDGDRDLDGCPDNTRVLFVFTDPDGTLLDVDAQLEDFGALYGRRLYRAGLEPGNYALTVTKPGYLPLTTPVSVPTGPRHRIVFVLTPEAALAPAI